MSRPDDRKARPILCHGTEVRAILAGKQTVFRRPITPQPVEIPEDLVDGHRVAKALLWDKHRWADRPPVSDQRPGPYGINLWAGTSGNPFGLPGDLLWVRETFALESCYETGHYEPPHHDGRPIMMNTDGEFTWWTQPHYRATDPTPDLCVPNSGDPGCHWRASIHMPRWASRISLRIEEVGVERLQAITEEDAKAEGVKPIPWVLDVPGRAGPLISHPSHRAAFFALWDEINSDRPAWKDNPWVWVIRFSPVSLTGHINER